MRQTFIALAILALSAIANIASAQRVVVDDMITEWTGHGNEYYYGPVGSDHLGVIYIKPFDQMGIQFYQDEVLYGVELYRDGYFFSTNYGFHICEGNGYVHKVREMPKYRRTSGMRFAYGNGYFNYGGIGRYNGGGYYGGGYYGGVSGGVSNGVGRVIQGTVDGAAIGATVGSSFGGAIGTVTGVVNAIKDNKARKAAERGYQSSSQGNRSSYSSRSSATRSSEEVSTRSGLKSELRSSSADEDGMRVSRRSR